MRESWRLGGVGTGCIIWLCLGLWRGEQIAGFCDVLGTGTVGEQAVATDAVEAAWQHVDEEAADELGCGERHDLVPLAAFDAIVFVFERDASAVERDQPAVGDGDAVGIARQISEHRLGSAERPLGVEIPLNLTQRRQIRSECFALGERDMLAKEFQATGVVGGDELLQKQSPEQPREHRHRQKVARPARDPPLTVERYSAARHDHVHVRVMRHGRAPGVQHSGDTDAGTQILGVGRNRDQRLGGCLEQQVVDHGLVLIGDVGDLGRQREHHMEVRHGQQLGLALGEPLPCGRALALWAVPVAAGVVCDDRVRAALATRNVAAESRRAAALNG